MTERQYQQLLKNLGDGAPASQRIASRAHQMNSWEQAYVDEVLEPERLAGSVLWYAFEPLKLRLANRTYYTPDFAVLRPSSVMEFHEIKGFVRDDAIIKLKVAAEQFPFRFIMVRRLPRGGGWDTILDLRGDSANVRVRIR